MIQRHFGPQDNDEQFIESLVKHGQPMNPNLNPEDLKVLMEQGDTYLAEGTKPFDPGALSENVSSALGAYQSVLSMDPANMDAAKGILAIANAYKAQANFHYERGEYQKADQMAKIAVRIWPDSVDLRRLNKNIRTNLDKDEG